MWRGDDGVAYTRYGVDDDDSWPLIKMYFRCLRGLHPAERVHLKKCEPHDALQRKIQSGVTDIEFYVDQVIHHAESFSVGTVYLKCCNQKDLKKFKRI